jgi:hypothetical protein
MLLAYWRKLLIARTDFLASSTPSGERACSISSIVFIFVFAVVLTPSLLVLGRHARDDVIADQFLDLPARAELLDQAQNKMGVAV